MNEVDAVKTASQREQIEHRLQARGPIYADVWKFGINTALRISDLFVIRLDEVRRLDPARPELRLIEGKTGKARTLTINSGAQGVIDRLLMDHPDDVWLFQSQCHRDRRDRKTHPKAITRRAAGRVFAAVGEQITPRVYLDTHSMRKTRGFAMHQMGRPIEKISKVLNHANTSVTMRYIGLDADTVSRRYDYLRPRFRREALPAPTVLRAHATACETLRRQLETGRPFALFLPDTHPPGAAESLQRYLTDTIGSILPLIGLYRPGTRHLQRSCGDEADCGVLPMLLVADVQACPVLELLLTEAVVVLVQLARSPSRLTPELRMLSRLGRGNATLFLNEESAQCPGTPRSACSGSAGIGGDPSRGPGRMVDAHLPA